MPPEHACIHCVYMGTCVHVWSWGRDKGVKGEKGTWEKETQGEGYTFKFRTEVLGEGRMGRNPMTGLGKQANWLGVAPGLDMETRAPEASCQPQPLVQLNCHPWVLGLQGWCRRGPETSQDGLGYPIVALLAAPHVQVHHSSVRRSLTEKSKRINI